MTGFVTIKNSPVTGSNFLKMLLFNSEKDNNLSLNQLCGEMKVTDGNSISKQGLDARFSKKSVDFVRSLFELFLQKMNKNLNTGLDCGWMNMFDSICIKDGTRFDLPESFAPYFKGFGGCSTSDSACCIQFEYDLKSGKILDLTLTHANVPDSKNAQLTKDDIKTGSLVLRDLGYFSLDIINEIIEKKAWIISKLNTQVKVYEQVNGKYLELDFNKLKLKTAEGTVHEMSVYIGEKLKIPVRLVLEKVPENVYRERIRKKVKEFKKKGHNMSEEYKSRQHFNLYITNIEKEKLPPQTIRDAYRLRWQIELVFKTWKSTFCIHKTHQMKYNRWMTLFYARMLVMLIHWQITQSVRIAKYKTENKLLSLSKCAKSLKLYTNKITALVGKMKNKIKTTLQELVELIWSNHETERKKGRVSQEEIFELIYCKSD